MVPVVPKRRTTKPKKKPTPFSRALRAARKAEGLSQAKVAADLKVDTLTVSRWERAVFIPNRWMLPAVIARFPQLANLAA